MKNLTRDNVVTLDFETFYSQDYTLSGREYNTSSYIRDEQFMAHCVGIKDGQGPTQVYDYPHALGVLAKMDLREKFLLAHNTAFDGLILSHHYGIKPYKYLDTLSMSRALFGLHTKHTLDALGQHLGLGAKLHGALEPTKGLRVLPPEIKAKLLEYNARDVDLCYEAFWLMYPSMPDSELELISMTVRMFCDPVLLVDIPRVEKYWLSQRDNKAIAVAKVMTKHSCGIEDLMSNDKFGALLTRLNVPVPIMKVSKTTGHATFAFAKTDPQFRAVQALPEFKDLCDARVAVKSTIGETRAERFIEAGKDGMPLPVMLNFWGAHTGRWSGGNKMNLQNLNRGGELRRSILAPPGYRIVVADSAQIEARVTAWLADHGLLLQAFRDGVEVYKAMASLIYRVPIEEVTKDQRFVGKVCVLGLGYGMGFKKLKATLEAGFSGGPPVYMTEKECKAIVDVYRAANPWIVGLWRTCDGIIGDMMDGATGQLKCVTWDSGYVRLPNKLKLLYPNLREDKGDKVYDTRTGHTKIYGGLLTENIVQAIARLIVAEQMLEVDKFARVVTMTHDEIVAICPEDEADDVLAKMIKIMNTPPKWAPDIPLGAAGGHDVCYSK